MKQTVLTFIFGICIISFVSAQSGTIQGIIIDQKLGDPLIGATIRLVGTELGTATDIDGFLALKECLRAPIVSSCLMYPSKQNH